jgi:hypothetical protein
MKYVFVAVKDGKFVPNAAARTILVLAIGIGPV